MADNLNFELEGLDSILGKFQEIEQDVKKRGGRFALRKAAQVVRDQARRNAEALDDPLTSNSIAENIVERWSSRRFKRTGDLGFRIGVLGGAMGAATAVGELTGSGKNNPGGDTFYWRFLEFGTQDIPARPFMRRALSDNITKATSEFVNQYDKALDRAIRRARKAQVTSS